MLMPIRRRFEKDRSGFAGGVRERSAQRERNAAPLLEDFRWHVPRPHQLERVTELGAPRHHNAGYSGERKLDAIDHRAGNVRGRRRHGQRRGQKVELEGAQAGLLSLADLRPELLRLPAFTYSSVPLPVELYFHRRSGWGSFKVFAKGN